MTVYHQSWAGLQKLNRDWLAENPMYSSADKA